MIFSFVAATWQTQFVTIPLEISLEFKDNNKTRVKSNAFDGKVIRRCACRDSLNQSNAPCMIESVFWKKVLSASEIFYPKNRYEEKSSGKWGENELRDNFKEVVLWEKRSALLEGESYERSLGEYCYVFFFLFLLFLYGIWELDNNFFGMRIYGITFWEYGNERTIF